MTFNIRERLLIGGPTGSSKTYSFLKIVQHLDKLNHVALEVDDGFLKLLLFEFPDIPATIYDLTDTGWVPREGVQRGDRLSVYHCQGFSAILAAQRELERKINTGHVGVGSWVGVDGGDLIYNSMRYEYLTKAGPALRTKPGQTAPADEWQAAMERKSTGAPLLEAGDWDAIHAHYERFLSYLAYQIPCHLYWATSLEVIDPRSKFVSNEAKDLAEVMQVPVKFEGQKKTPRCFDTLIGMKHDASGYYIHLWKDRGSEGRPWKKLGRHSPSMLYTNNDFYDDIGVKLLGFPE